MKKPKINKSSIFHGIEIIIAAGTLLSAIFYDKDKDLDERIDKRLDARDKKSSEENNGDL